ncbi:MAG: hypothetical protein AAFR38_13080 [Planctomycetota bacterium]
MPLDARESVPGSGRSSVLLEHALPDGTRHLDWMLERASNAERRLVTFRLESGLDPCEEPVFEAERIGDHRAAYLEFEGEVSGGRGVVRRVWRRPLLSLIETPSVHRIELADGVRLTGTMVRDPIWRFARAS